MTASVYRWMAAQLDEARQERDRLRDQRLAVLRLCDEADAGRGSARDGHLSTADVRAAFGVQT